MAEEHFVTVPSPRGAYRLALLTIAGALLLALAVFAWRGSYSRYVTDDYCTASLLQTLGFAEAMKHHRQNWSGRFSYFPLKAMFEIIGPVTTRSTPGLMIVLLTLTALHATRKLLPPIRLHIAALLSLAFVFALVESSPSLTNIGGALFWETGSVTYMTPLILLLAWLGLLVTRRRLPLACAASALIMFIAGGFSETSLAAQGALTGLVMVLALVHRARPQAWIAACGLMSTLVALIVMGTAPGNAVRVDHEVHALSPPDAIVRTFRLAYDFTGTYVFPAPLGYLCLILVAIAAGYLSRRSFERVPAEAAAISFCVFIVAFLPGAWLMPSGPPERALDIPNFFLLGTVALLSFAAGGALRGARIPGEPTSRTRLAAAAVLILIVVAPVESIRRNMKTIPEARRLARQFDEMDRLLRASRGRAVTLRVRLVLSQKIFDPDPDYWVNRCVSRYYGLQTFRAIR